MMKPARYVLNFLRKLSSINAVGGLSVSDSAIRYFKKDENNKVTTASLRLPPGIVEDGKVKNRDLAVNAFNQIRSMIGASGGSPVEIIMSVESGVAYSQFFTLPQLDAAGIKEAAELNIQMISPINIAHAYYGYQMIGEASGGIGFEFLGGFVPSTVIDDWLSVLKEANFITVAVEFQALSIVRAAMEDGGLDAKSINIVLDVSSEGLDIMIVKNGNLYFDYFYSWRAIQENEKSITLERFQKVVSTEVGKVMNFSLSRFGGEVKNIYVNAAGTVGDKLVDAISIQSPGARVSKLVMKSGVSPLWGVAFGAFLRGSKVRSEDILISLSPLTVVAEYSHRQVINMVSLWGRILAGVMVFLIFVMGASDLLLRRAELDVEKQSIRGLSGAESTEFSKLSREAAEFNQLISLIGEARRGESRLYPFLERISNLSADVRLTRLSIQSPISPISINGTASSADAVSRFHRQLAATKGVSDIQFPLSSLVSTPDGRTSFIMSFKIASFDI